MGSRQNKSQRLAYDLRRWGEDSVIVQNPLRSEMTKTAKHIEWLELIITGISHEDRNTIVKIERHSKRRDLIIVAKGIKISELKAVILDLKDELKETINNWKNEVQIMEKEKRELTPELRDEAEKDFIKNLQTFDQEQRARNKAYNEGIGRSTYSSASSSEWFKVR